MIFLYHKDAGASRLNLEGEEYHYLFKVRRERSGAIISLRNLKDDLLYSYEIEEVGKKDAAISLIDSVSKPVTPKKELHIAWAIVDVKNIEKTLPFLNEIGVGRITFFYASRSQKNFKINIERLERIIISSCEQCGRSDRLKIDIKNSTKELLEGLGEFLVLDFCDKKLGEISSCDTYVIGPEGGFCDKERAMFGDKVRGFDSDFVFRSESAVAALASKYML